MAKFRVSWSNRWLRLALVTAIVAFAFAGARLLALGLLFAGLAVWAVKRWRAGKRLLAYGLAAALVVGVGLYGFAAFEVWSMRAWRAGHFDDMVLLAADGTYEGEGRGKRGPVRVEVTVRDHRVEEFDVVEFYDTIPIAEGAFEELREGLVGRSDADVDAVTGATRTSYGTINAVREAVWRGVAEAPRLSVLSKITLWFASVKVQKVTFHSLAVLFIVVLLFDYTIQAALVEGTGQTLNCMDCQTCVGACPVKRVDGWLFPMEMVLRARLGDYETVARLMEYCVGCAKCAAKCPAGISAPSVAAAVAHYLRKQKREEEAEFFESRV
ncbi:MAG: FMN-binding protein [Candidatus Coatesbacteria bacterium]|nr:MAG: FMN-binding protein [Candidatus Coatesbacteria bacterium]